MVAPENPRPRKRVFSNLKSKYRLLLINDRTFEERLSLRLTRINMILLAVAGFIVIAVLVGATIMFTPLKKLVPGYADHDLTRYAYRSMLMADSLARVLPVQQQYLDNLRRVLSGEIPADSTTRLKPVGAPPTAGDLRPSAADSVLRHRIAQEEAYSLTAETGDASDRRELAGIVFFPPMRGLVTQPFDPQKGHFGIDVVAKADEAVKAALNGTVILASWTSDGGHVIHLQHAGGLTSLYKHNAVLLKKTGDRVKAGETIAIVGDSGELSDGPHLHFELWLNGEAIDPAAYMVFQ